MRKVLFLTAPLGVALAAAAHAATSQAPTTPQSCSPPISEAALRIELAKTPYFANGIPPPGKVMSIEPTLCGYVVYVGTHSPDEIGNTVFQVDGNGHITAVNTTY
jgi:hypothetical protein